MQIPILIDMRKTPGLMKSQIKEAVHTRYITTLYTLLLPENSPSEKYSGGTDYKPLVLLVRKRFVNLDGLQLYLLRLKD